MRKLALVLALAPPLAIAAEPVTVDTFVRAESDHMIRANMAAFGAEIGEFVHVRKPTTPDNQPVIRMNQDTLYSGAVLDLSKPVEITLPELDGRYQSMHVVSQDHYMVVESSPGTYRLTQDDVGTRFALLTIRTFADVTDAQDVKAAHAAQDKLGIDGGGKGPFEAPDWDLEDLAVARQALNDIAVLGFETQFAFGSPEQTRPVDHLIGAAAGWGGLPKNAAMYVLDSVEQNDGTTPHAVTVKDVPVEAFWSITVYNAEGYLEANDLGVNNYNNFTARQDQAGAYTIHFGGCDDGRENCIPITDGWNYAIRMYQPGESIQSGKWQFPEPQPTE